MKKNTLSYIISIFFIAQCSLSFASQPRPIENKPIHENQTIIDAEAISEETLHTNIPLSSGDGVKRFMQSRFNASFG